MHFRTKLISLFLLLLGLVAFETRAGRQSWIAWEKGTNLSVGTKIVLSDPEHGVTIPVSAIYTSQFKVKYRYDQKQYTVNDAFTSTVGYTLTLYHAGGTSTVETGNLSIEFSAQEGVTHKDIHEKAYKSVTATDPYVSAELEVTSISFKDANGTTIPAKDEVFLDVVYSVDRYFEMDATAPVAQHEFSTNTDSKNEQNELLLSWDHTVGAEYYDVEWVFVNTGDLSQSNLTAAQFPVDFSQSVRVSVTDNHYRISLTYPEGYLLYRVRPVGIDLDVLTTNSKLKWMNGNWSNQSISTVANLDLAQAMAFTNVDGKPNHVKVNGFEKSLNWTYSATYAEDGKYAESVAFFDGSQRNRQGVGSMNSDKTKIVSESKYDYEGRPTVNILPVPIESQGLKYYRGNGNSEFNGSFDRTDFSIDGHLNLKDPFNNLSAPLPANSEVNKYYSSANTLDRPFVEYTPDAQGFPYTQIKYDNDGTDRILAQSGVGKTFRLKSDYVSRNYYVNTTQEELNRLFGNEVGYVSHYKKVIAKDANGQLSVSYLNSGNKTIASAMMGVTPENMIDVDEKDPAAVITSNLLQNGSDKLSNGDYVKRHTFFADPGSAPTLAYRLQPIQYSDNCHPNSPIDIKYDVMLHVEEEEGEVLHSIVAPGGFPEKSYKTSINSTSENLSISDDPMGVRRISKSLRMNKDAFDLQYDVLENKLKTDLENVKQDYTAQLQAMLLGTQTTLTPSTVTTCIPFPVPQMEPCFTSCEDECEAIYKEERSDGTTIYYDENFNEYTSPTEVAHIAAVKKCKANCADNGKLIPVESPCDQKLKALKIQISPGGSYFDNLPNKYVIDSYTGVAMNVDGERTIVPNYQNNPALSSDLINNWLQTNLNFNTVKTALVATFGSSANSLTDWNDLRENWQTNYANELVKFHPEHCTYQFYCLSNTTYCCKAYLQGAECPCPIDYNATEVNAFEQRITGILDNSAAIETIGGNTYNYFLPVPMSGLTNVSAGILGDNHLYHYDFNGNNTSPNTYDPLSSFFYDLDILDKLQNFINVTVAGQTYRYSFWYVLKNPDNINASTVGVPNQIKAVFDNFHDPTTGIIATGQVEEIQVFVSFYNFYRKKYIYELYKTNHTDVCGISASYSEGDTDYNTYLNNGTPTIDDDFPLVFPREYQFDNWSTFTDTTFSDSISAQLMRYQMQDNCVAAAHRWIKELKENGCLSGLSIPEVTNLREKLIEICQNGGNEHLDLLSNAIASTSQAQIEDWSWKSMFGSDACTTNVIITHNGGTTTVNNFTQALAVFGITSATCIVEHPAANSSVTKPDSDCHWSQLQSLTGLTYDEDDPANPSAFANSVRNWLSSNGHGSYSPSQIENWIKFFNGDPNGTLLQDAGEPVFPHVFECSECKCEKFKAFVEELGYTYTSLSNSDRIDLADELNTTFDLTGSDAITEDDIEDYFKMCQSNGISGDFDKFPAIFRCLGDNGKYDPMNLHHVCIVQSFYDALANSEVAYREEMKQKLRKFKKDYYAKAFEDIHKRESLELTYRLNEYYYTLYYYDQADNLIKTVPPKGVNPLDLTLYNTAVNDYRNGLSSGIIRPEHTFVTNYDYNSFNQPYKQETPDGGQSNFWYDELERIVVSQNAEQNTHLEFSYTHYDGLGRIHEVGQVVSTTSMADAIAYNATNLAGWFNPTVENSKTEITTTLYDEAATNVPAGFQQENIRNRVAASYYYPTKDELTAANYETGTFYSYDIHGNVNELMQSLPVITRAGRINKKVQYDYDLLSGNVNKVSYNPDDVDQFYHRYYYDDNNRLTEVETSRDNEIWEKEAKYYYYPTGTLARVELGDKQVQAQDYAYSLQGWLKGVNASTLSRKRDIGKDALLSGSSRNLHTLFAEDELGYTLSYFDEAKLPGQSTSSALLNDYTPIKAGMIGYDPSNAFEARVGAGDPYQTAVHNSTNGLTGHNALASLDGKKMYAPLYNGNISRMVVALSDVGETPMAVHNNVYRYDQSNRLKSMNVFWSEGTDKISEQNNFAGVNNAFDYHTEYEYDRNGNITGLLRNAYQKAGINLDMDLFSYKYNNKDNKLRVVDDAIPMTSNWSTDLEDQMGTIPFDTNSADTNFATHNYLYDKSGNLIQDKSEEIDRIEWTVSGKVKSIERTSGSNKPDLEFFYDPTGNRVAKLVKPRTGTGLTNEYDWSYMYYVRDASGDVMANYSKSFAVTGCNVTVELGAIQTSKSNPIHTLELGGTPYPVTIGSNPLLQTLIDQVNGISGYSAQQTGSNSFSVNYKGSGACISERLGLLTNLNSYSFDFVTGSSIERFKLVSHDVYGSDRLGQDQQEIILDENTFTANIDTRTKKFRDYRIEDSTTPVHTTGERWLGHRRYELKNHLGNVMSVVSDRRICEDKVLYSNDFSSSYQPFFSAQTYTLENGRVKVYTTGPSQGAWYNQHQSGIGKNYNVSFDFDPGTTASYALVINTNPYYPSTSQTFPIVSGLNSIDFTSKSEGLLVSIQRLSPGSTQEYFYLDDFELIEKCVQGDQNILAQDYNAGTYSWQQTGASYPTSVLQVESDQLNLSSTASGAGVYKTLPVTTGKLYMLQYELTNSGGAFPYGIEVHPYHFNSNITGDNGVYSGLTQQTPNAAAHFYQAVDLNMKWVLQREGTNGMAASLNLDNVKVVEVVESNSESSISTDVIVWSHVSYGTSNPASVTKSNSAGALVVDFNTGSEDNGFELLTQLNVNTGKYYKIVFDLTINGTGNKVNIGYAGKASTYTTSGTYAIAFEANAPLENLSIYNVTSGMSSAFSAELSNIKLEEVHPGAAIYRETFNQHLYGWEKTGSTELTAVNNALQFKTNAVGDGAKYEQIQLDPFTTYELTLDVNTLTWPTGAGINISAFKTGITTKFDGGVGTVSPAGAEMTVNSNGTYTLQIETDETTSAYLAITNNTSSGSTVSWAVDNLQLKKVGGYSTNFTADVMSVSDYYPFGMEMPGRNANSGDYRYSFGGHEKDDEVKGNGNHLSFGDYGYDPRLGRRWNIDPVDKPYESSYATFANNPIAFVDPDGEDAILIVFPDYKIDTESPLGRIGGLGHAGVLLIDNKTGTTKYYEYGRYRTTDGTKGRVKHYAIPNVVIGKDGQPTAESLAKVMSVISQKSGHGGRIRGAYIKSDKFQEMNDYAQEKYKESNPQFKEYDKDRDPYTLTGNNCGTFAADCVEQDDDVDGPWFITNPTPINIIDEYIEEGNKEVNFDNKSKSIIWGDPDDQEDNSGSSTQGSGTGG